METYKYYCDTKVTIWNRSYFNIEADTDEDATAKLKELQDSGFDFYKCELEIDSQETLYDTECEMSVEENGGCETKECYTIAEELLFTNADKKK